MYAAFEHLFGGGKVYSPNSQPASSPVTVTAFSQPNVLRKRMEEEKLSHGTCKMRMGWVRSDFRMTWLRFNLPVLCETRSVHGIAPRSFSRSFPRMFHIVKQSLERCRMYRAFTPRGTTELSLPLAKTFFRCRGEK